MNIPTMQELYDLAYIRGAWTCPKCGFELTKCSISVESGDMGTSETDRQSEQCPNDGEMMLPATYKAALQSWRPIIGDLMTMRQRLRELLDFAPKDVEACDIETILDGNPILKKETPNA